MLLNMFNELTQYVTSMTNWLNSVTGGNEFLAAAMGAGFMGLLVKLRFYPGKIIRGIRDRFVISKTVSIAKQMYGNSYDDETFPLSVVKELYQSRLRFQIRSVSPVSEYMDYQQANYSVDTSNGPVKIGFPSEGRYFLFYRGRLIWFTFHYAKQENTSVENMRYLVFKASTFGLGLSFIDKMVSDLSKKYTPPSEENRWIYVDPYRIGSFNYHRHDKGSLSGCYYDAKVTDLIRKRFSDFFNRRDWYTKRNIRYVESFLLYGPPGTGKTSLIKAITNDFQMEIRYLNATAINKYGISYNQITDGEHGKPICVVIEDIDSVGAALQRSVESKPDDEFDEAPALKRALPEPTVSSESFTVSDLLNMLDGIVQVDNVIFIFTTNHIEKLDPALLRKGRINHLIEIPNLSEEGVDRFIKVNFGDDHSAPVDTRYDISIASIQHHYLSNIDDYDNFIKEIEVFKVE